MFQVVPIRMVGLTFIFFQIVIVKICNRFWFFGCSFDFVKNMFYKSQTFNLLHKHLDICVSMFSPRLNRHGFCCYPNFTKSLFFIFYKYCQISIVHYGNKISMFVFTHGKVLKCGHLPTLSLCLTIIISCGPLFWQCSHPQAFLPYA